MKYPRLNNLAAKLTTVLLLAAVAAPTAWAQQSPNQPTVIKLALHPKAIEAPLLHYTLLPRIEDTEPGNAAVHFLNAVTATLTAGRDAAKNDRLEELIKAPLEELTAEEHLDDFRLPPNARTEMLSAARCADVHWDNTIRVDGFRALLPSLGVFRVLSRGMALEARIAIKDHRWSDAIQFMQINYAFAHDLCQGDTLIESLVAATIDADANEQLTLFVQQPDAPNLFWALATLPRPLIDDQRAFRQERALMYFTFPELKDARLGKFYPGQWHAFVRHFNDISGAFPSSLAMDIAGSTTPPALQMESAAFGYILYGPAKRYLAAHGFSDSQLDALPVEETLMRFLSAAYETISDDTMAWTLAPFWQNHPGQDTQQALNEHPDLNIFPLNVIVPSLSRAQVNLSRVERNRAALAVVEALRDYTAHSDGALPDKLADISNLPLPVDPVWNKPFEYSRTADSAVLTSAPPLGTASRDGLRIEIHLEKLDNK